MKRINERYNKEVELSELKELCKNKREMRQLDIAIDIVPDEPKA